MKSLIIPAGFILLLIAGISSSCKKNEVPALSTNEVTGITGTSAICGGTIISEGSGTIITTGVCWSTDSLPVIENDKTTDIAEAGIFTSNITGLQGATAYYVRAYATNSAGTGYGEAVTFSTLGQLPGATISEVTDIYVDVATLNGSVNANLLPTIVTFDYGTSTSYGKSVTALQSPVTGDSLASVSASITGLIPGTTYHFRIKAVNSLGTSYSDDSEFVTLGKIPDVNIQKATGITSSAAVLNAAVNPNYLSAQIIFEYGKTTAYTDSVTAVQSPMDGSILTNVSANISGLEAGKTYHFRIKAENSLGKSYSKDEILITQPRDIDNNVYKIVTIGTQVWMAENLKATKLNDGYPLDFAPDKATWQALSNPGYCWYDNNSVYKNTYGALYNWEVVKTGKICPAGWHVPADAEWTILSNYLGGLSVAGGKIKETGTAHWASPNTGATNESGFTALAAGFRSNLGEFSKMTFNGCWWSSTELSTTDSYRMGTDNASSNLNRLNELKKNGYSVRCIKDE